MLNLKKKNGNKIGFRSPNEEVKLEISDLMTMKCFVVPVDKCNPDIAVSLWLGDRRKWGKAIEYTYTVFSTHFTEIN